MKIKEVKLNNFMKYDKVSVSFDERVTYLVGKNGSGKSSAAIYGVQAILQGIAEKASGGSTPLFGERFRFIGPKGPTSSNELTLIDEKNGNAEIVIRRKITKTGSELSISAPDSYGQLDQSWLNNLFNIFLIAPKQFQLLSPKEQANALGIDTSPYDKDIAALKLEYTAIGRDVKAFGDLPPVEEVEEVDVKELQEKKETIRKGMALIYRQNQETNKATREAWEADKKAVDEFVTGFNNGIEATKKARAIFVEAEEQIKHLSSQNELLITLVDFTKLTALIENFEPLALPKVAADLYPTEPTNLSDKEPEYEPAENEKVYIIEMPDGARMKAIDQEIVDAAETNRKALLYSQYVQKKSEKEAKENELADNKVKQSSKEQGRSAFIAAFKFPFSNLTVGEDGELLLAGKPIREPYFSTGEILKIIPILISTRNPDLKYVFLQDFNLMDEEKQEEIEKYLTDKGFQLVIEYVGREKLTDKNCILLKDNCIVESYKEEKEPELSL